MEATETKKKKLVVKRDTNSVINILTKIRLLMRFGVTDLSETSQEELVPYSEADWERVWKIFSKKDLTRMAWYFMEHGAATAFTLQKRLELSQSTTYRYLEDLRMYDFVAHALKTSKPRGKKGGPRSDVWMVPDATIDQINEAQALHRRLMSPKYVAGERLGRLILEEYLEPRRIDVITKREVQEIARDQGIKGNLSDIVVFAMNYLQFEKGIKVWR